MNNKALQEIFQLIQHRQLGEALAQTENYLLMHQRGNMEVFNAIKDDYQLMSDYWLRGFDDPSRKEIYCHLLQRLYKLIADIDVNQWMKDNPYLMSIRESARQSHSDWSVASVRHELEEFVSESALLQLEPEHVRKAHAEKLYKDHQLYLTHLFTYILTSHQWKESVADAFTDILLSPTIDSVDQQLIVSAVTLSAMQTFDFHKVKLLVDVYRKASDEPLRQRALVGWVLGIDDKLKSVYDELSGLIRQLCDDDRCRRELAELQMQFFYCLDAEKDTKKIQSEIMPDLMNGSNLKITPRGLAEVEEDSLEEILNPNAAEENMERMEQSMRRMVDMQKQGADIYFGGFSQMKRFPFFSEIANWFVPYFPEHPAVSGILSNARGKKFLEIITRIGAFCDSDKYSFVLAYNQVLGHIPESMLKMIDEGEATPIPVGGEISEEEQSNPAFIRRLYLQDLYRFYRLFPTRNVFHNPFQQSDSAQYVFFANPLFRNSALEWEFMKIIGFLLKRKLYDEAWNILINSVLLERDFSYYMAMGTIIQALTPNAYDDQTHCFKEALRFNPDSEKALSCYARACFGNQDYEESLKSFRQLADRHPEHKGYQLNTAICLSRLSQYDEALKILYKLNYENPNDINVNRVLAWTLTLDGSYEQAAKLYAQLVSSDAKPTSEDMLNYGQCQWLSGNRDAAKALFRRYVGMTDDGMVALRKELTRENRKLLSSRGISDVDIQLMLDAVSL